MIVTCCLTSDQSDTVQAIVCLRSRTLPECNAFLKVSFCFFCVLSVSLFSAVGRVGLRRFCSNNLIIDIILLFNSELWEKSASLLLTKRVPRPVSGSYLLTLKE